jgi:thymidylate kinase
MIVRESPALCRRNLILALFGRLDAGGVRYVALHSYESLPDDLPSDLDLAVHPADAGALAAVFAALRTMGYQPVQCLNYAVAGYYFVFLWNEDDGLHSLAIDFTFEHREGGRILMSGAELIEGRVRHGAFWIPCPQTEFGYLLGKKTMKGNLPERQALRLGKLAEQMGRTTAEAVAARWFGEESKGRVVDACLSGEMGALMDEMRSRFLRTLFRRDPLNALRHHVTELPRMLRRLLRPAGLSVAVLGPDGAGKSTLVKEIVRQVQPAFRSTRVYHWRPYVLRGKLRTSASDPHGKPADSSPRSSLRLIAHVLDYWLGYALRIRPALAHAGLVVFDRYFQDLLADPRRYRYGGPVWMVNAAARLVPDPDLVLILDAPEEIVRARKQEVAPAEIARQRRVYHGLAAAFPRTTILNAAEPADTVSRQACRAVTGLMASRLGRHAGRFGLGDGGDGGMLVEAVGRVQDGAPEAGRVHTFAILPSRQDPRLLVPLGDRGASERALEIYSPYQRKARMLKRGLTLAIGSGSEFWARHRVSLPAGSLNGLEHFVAEITGEANPRFAFSLGRPVDARKFTVQAMRPGGAILGYLKFPLNDAAADRIRYETATLDRLNHFNTLRPSIPQVLFAGEWRGQSILFQSAGEGEPGPAHFNGLHARFLKDLRRVTAIQRSGDRVAEEVAAMWDAAGDRIPAEWRDLGRDALRLAGRELRGAEIACGLSHGDFAPWNTRVRDGRLFVFDWESAEWDMPIWWDLFHFDMQVNSLLGRRSGIEMGHLEAPAWHGLYLLYLLRSVVRCAEDSAGAEAFEYRRNRLAALMAGKPQLKVLEPIHVGSRY